MRLLAEDLLLLVVDLRPRGGPPPGLVPVVGGALLADLALAGCITVAGRVRPTGVPVPDDDPLLAEALALAGPRGVVGQVLVGKVGQHLAAPLLERLRQLGMVEKHDGEVEGPPRPTWEVVQGVRVDVLRRDVSAAMTMNELPSEHVAVLVSLLASIGLLQELVPVQGEREHNSLQRRAWQLGLGTSAGGVLSEVNAAVMSWGYGPGYR